MEYIKQADYDYIINKYHDAAKPFDPLKFNRWYRRDEIFDINSGLDGEDIKKGILAQDEIIKHLPPLYVKQGHWNSF